MALLKNNISKIVLIVITILIVLVGSYFWYQINGGFALRNKKEELCQKDIQLTLSENMRYNFGDGFSISVEKPILETKIINHKNTTFCLVRTVQPFLIKFYLNDLFIFDKQYEMMMKPSSDMVKNDKLNLKLEDYFYHSLNQLEPAFIIRKKIDNMWFFKFIPNKGKDYLLNSEELFFSSPSLFASEKIDTEVTKIVNLDLPNQVVTVSNEFFPINTHDILEAQLINEKRLRIRLKSYEDFILKYNKYCTLYADRCFINKNYDNKSWVEIYLDKNTETNQWAVEN